MKENIHRSTNVQSWDLVGTHPHACNHTHRFLGNSERCLHMAEIPLPGRESLAEIPKPSAAQDLHLSPGHAFTLRSTLTLFLHVLCPCPPPACSASPASSAPLQLLALWYSRRLPAELFPRLNESPYPITLALLHVAAHGALLLHPH